MPILSSYGYKFLSTYRHCSTRISAVMILKIKIEIVFFPRINQNQINVSGNQTIDFRRRDQRQLEHNEV